MLAVLFGAIISALGAMVLLISLQYNLQSVRSDRLQLQADTLADAAIDEALAYVRYNDGIMSTTTNEWTLCPTSTALQLITNPSTTIKATANIFYREINANYFSATKAYYGFMMPDNGTSAFYDIYGFGLVQITGQDSILQKYKRVFKSTTGVSVNFFVQASQSASFLQITK